MRDKRFWSALRERLWCVPSLILAISIALAITLSATDSAGPKP